MIDFKNMDNEDFVFVKQNISEKEEKAFSDFLKNRKTKKLKPNKTKVIKQKYELVN